MSARSWKQAAGTTISNMATIAEEPSDPDVTNNSATAVTTVSVVTLPVAQAQQPLPGRTGASLRGWDYKTLPVDDVQEGQRLMREMDAQGREMVAAHSNIMMTRGGTKSHLGHRRTISSGGRGDIQITESECVILSSGIFSFQCFDSPVISVY